MKWYLARMTVAVAWCILAVLSLSGVAMIPQSAAAVVIVASKTVVVSGEGVRLSALMIDDGGGIRQAESVSWISSDPAVAAIDSAGLASTRALGVASVHALVDGVSSQDLLLQVLPSKIELTAPRNKIFVGEELQLTARALDVDGKPLDPVDLQWEVLGGDGTPTPVASIDNTGLLKSAALGLVSVRAFIRYAVVANGPGTFDAFVQVSITPRTEYRLTRLLATDPLRRSFQLRPNYISSFAVNDSNQIAFVANLDGLSSALMLYDNGRFDVLAGAGTPAFVPGNFIYDFETPSINNKGEVLTRVYAPVDRPGNGLMLASRSGSTMIRLEGSSEPGTAEMHNFRTTRYSLNDSREVVFLSEYTDDNKKARTGLFKQSGAHAQLLASSGDRLAALPAEAELSGDFFGVDAVGTAYFLALAGSGMALYSSDGIQPPQKIVATGDGLAGSAIVSISGITVSREGTLAMGVRLANNAQVLLKYAKSSGRISTLPINTLGPVHSVNDAGDVLFQGDLGSGWSLLRFTGDAATSLMVFGQSHFSNGQSLIAIRDAAITARGDLYTIASSPDDDYVFTQGNEARTLFEAGQRIDARFNVNFVSAVGGAHTGPPQLFTGGVNASVYQFAANGLEPVWVTGDRLWPGVSSGPLTGAARSPSGNLYLMTPPGIARLAAGHTEPVLRFPLDLQTDAGTVTVFGGAAWYDRANFLAVNDNEKLVFAGVTASNLFLLASERGRLTPLMTFGPNASRSPAGGFFAGLVPAQGRQPAIAVDDGGRVMVNAAVSGGPSGLFLFENGEWRPVGLLNDERTDIQGRRISVVWAFRAAGNTFYAILIVSDGNMIIADYRDGKWNPLVRLFDVLPDGLDLNGLSPAFDVNRRGDIAFVALANEMSIVVRTADGKNHLVTTTGSPTADGDWFGFQRFDLDLREDGRLYFIGIDFLDRNLLYIAEPESDHVF